jgi:hypothetical protein
MPHAFKRNYRVLSLKIPSSTSLHLYSYTWHRGGEVGAAGGRTTGRGHGGWGLCRAAVMAAAMVIHSVRSECHVPWCIHDANYAR